MPDSDRVLIRRALTGDNDAFGELLERYSPLVHGVILERVRRMDEVEDLVQDVFVKAYQSLVTLRDVRRFAPWIARIAANISIDWIHRRQRRSRADEEGQQRWSVSLQPDEELERDQTHDMVWQALDRLPIDYRRIVVLYYVEGCRQADIARFLGLTLTTVKWRLYRARTLLHADITTLLGAHLGLHRNSLQRTRDRAMGALPLLTFLHPPPTPSPLWRRMTPAAAIVVGGLGLAAIGNALSDRLMSLQDADTPSDGPAELLSVRYEPRELPGVSVQTTPSQPMPGAALQLQLAGLSDEAPEFYLHYVTQLRDPEDRVVPMEHVGEIWQASLPVPVEAANLFYYASTADQPVEFAPRTSSTDRNQQLRAYKHGLMLYGDDGRPVPNAHVGMGRLNGLHEGPIEASLAAFAREVAVHPRNAEGYKARWSTLQWSVDDLVAGNQQARRERAALLARFPDDPNLAWETIDRGDTLATRQFVERFPHDERVPMAAFAAAIRPVGEHDRIAEKLRAFLRDYPRSPYTTSAYHHMLYAYGHADTATASALADSLIDGSIVAHYDPDQERGRPALGYTGIYGGLYAESAAYLSRFRQHQQLGDTLAARHLAERLLHSRLADPIPYLYMADETQDRRVAARLLERAEPWTTVSHMETLPYFLSDPQADSYFSTYKRDRIHSLRARLLRNLGADYLAAGRLVQAEQALTESFDIQNGTSHTEVSREDVLLRHLARVHERLGHCDKAVAANERILELTYHDGPAEAALRRLYDQGCGTDISPQQRTAALWQPMPTFCARWVQPAIGGADSLCVADIDAPAVLLYRGGHLTTGAIERLDALRDVHSRFAPHGLRILYIAAEGTTRPGDGGPAYRQRDRVAEAMAVHDWPFTILISDDSHWPSLLSKRGYGASQIWVLDTGHRLRLQLQVDWVDSGRVRQDSVVTSLLDELLARPAATQVARRTDPCPTCTGAIDNGKR
jgi:RNA polymerase sigma-70 factor, ECF subfamily